MGSHLLICIFLFFLQSSQEVDIKTRKVLTDNQIHYLSDLTNVQYTQTVLNNLLVPRVVGTKGHENVFNYITQELQNLGYHLDIDEFQQNAHTHGKLTFKNIVARLNPEAHKYLVFSCHYDSKLFKEFEFIGATDSAVPCAMMLNLAKVLSKELSNAKNQTSVSLKLIFFDGEEAFGDWTEQDSLYGSKHLAKKWEKSLHRTAKGNTIPHLQSIDLLILLDLLGDKNPKIPSFFQNTEQWYVKMSNAERRLANLGLFANYKGKYFIDRRQFSYIEDDHVPFLQRGVKIMHIIPTPFPRVWHQQGDNANIVNLDTVENFNKIFRIFTAEYLNLSVL
ncbi:hypothetical protein FQR65_LT11534 [Abscondita terminalis]|nr:hypothetical protein FQR65_LT11534 [Abscondita terminalis]